MTFLSDIVARVQGAPAAGEDARSRAPVLELDWFPGFPLLAGAVEAADARSFDLAAIIRPGREPPALPPERPRQLHGWLGLALSLAAHVAVFAGLMFWSSPLGETAPPEAVEVEIVAEAPPIAEPSPPPAVETPPPVAESPPPGVEPSPPPIETPIPTPVAEAPPAPVVEPPPVETPTPVAELPPPVAEPSPPPIETPTPTPVAEAPPAPVVEPPPPVETPTPVAELPPPVADPSPPPVETTTPMPVAEAPPPPVVEPPPAVESLTPGAEAPPLIVAAPPPPAIPAPPLPRTPPPLVVHQPPRAPAPIFKPPPAKARVETPRRARLAEAEPSAPSSRQPVVTSPEASADAAAYQGAVLGRIASEKRYPEAARERGPQGVAIVRFSVGAAGQLLQASLAKSAGDPLLDAEALATVRRAGPFPPPPVGAPRNFSASLNYRMR